MRENHTSVLHSAHTQGKSLLIYTFSAHAGRITPQFYIQHTRRKNHSSVLHSAHTQGNCGKITHEFYIQHTGRENEGESHLFYTHPIKHTYWATERKSHLSLTFSTYTGTMRENHTSVLHLAYIQKNRGKPHTLKHTHFEDERKSQVLHSARIPHPPPPPPHTHTPRAMNYLQMGICALETSLLLLSLS